MKAMQALVPRKGDLDRAKKHCCMIVDGVDSLVPRQETLVAYIGMVSKRAVE